MMCSFSWKNIVSFCFTFYIHIFLFKYIFLLGYHLTLCIRLQVVVVIAVLILQITYSNGEKGKCEFKKFKEDQGNDCCFYEPECKSIITTQPSYIDVWVSKKINIYKTEILDVSVKNSMESLVE